MKQSKQKKEKKEVKPIFINEDIWFYPVGKHFEFIVWSTHNNIGNRQAVHFNIPHSKLKKYLK